MRLIDLYLPVASLVLLLVMLTLQIGSWRRTRHRSLLILALSTLLGIAYVVAAYLPITFEWAFHARAPLYLLCMAIVTVESVLVVWGSASLFQAFEAALRSAATNGNEGRG